MHSNDITVLTTVFASDVVKYYKNDTQYYASFVNDVGSPLSNTNVTFNINGVYYTRSTNDKGVAKLNINLNPDNYTITAINSNNGEMHSNNIEVLPTIYADDLTMIYRNDRFVAHVLDNQGNPLAHSNVTFNINGVLTFFPSFLSFDFPFSVFLDDFYLIFKNMYNPWNYTGCNSQSF